MVPWLFVSTVSSKLEAVSGSGKLEAWSVEVASRSSSGTGASTSRRPRTGDGSNRNPAPHPTQADHLEHHKRLTAHYAAPTFSVDRILAYFVGQPESWGSKFDAAEQVDDAPMKTAPAPPAEACPVGAGGEAYPIGAKAE